MGCTKSSVKREFIAIQAYFKKQEKTNKQPNLTHFVVGFNYKKKKKKNNNNKEKTKLEEKKI